MKKTITLFSFIFLLFGLSFAQNIKPIQVKVSQKRVSPTEIEAIFEATIAQHWHVYSTNLPEDGPTSASFQVDNKTGIEPVGNLKFTGKELSVFDKMFEMQVRYFENKVTFTQNFKITQKNYHLKGYLEYGACNDEQCLPPTAVDIIIKGDDGVENTVKKNETPTDSKTIAITQSPSDTTAQTLSKEQQLADTTSIASAINNASPTDWWKPVVGELKSFGETEGSSTDYSLWVIFILGFGGGLLALFTPCVWPIIPMTVSFFLKRNTNRSKGIKEALIYGFSIIVIYVSLGLLVTLIKGPSALNDLSTNALFNILFFLMLVVFGASFLGGFEIALPSKWTQAVDSKAESTAGLLSIFLMAFTLALVSFSCTGPIIGFLLVEVATTTNLIAPAMGMLGFAVALALPFSLFALFPSWLKEAPKSGGWMNTIKVSLGILELAFALKFLSVADLAYGWHILDREVFLCLWIVLFAILGFYWLGKIHLPHDEKQEHTSVPRFFIGTLILSFSLYMVPGLWGAPLKAISAFSPPLFTQDFKVHETVVEPQFKDFDEGMAYAKQVGKPVMIDFTGFGCVNCRKMEIAVWHDAEVAKKINEDYVLISLYVDDKTKLPAPIEVTENGNVRTLRTIGDKWSYLQSTKFGYNAQPFYVLLDNEGKPLTSAYTFDEDIKSYLNFLNKGLQQYKNKL